MYARRTNKMSMMHYDMLALMYRNLITSSAFATTDEAGATRVVVGIHDLLKVTCETMKADNPRFIDRLFVDACVRSDNKVQLP